MQALNPIDVTCTLCLAEPGAPCIDVTRRSQPEVKWVHYNRIDTARDTNLPDGITSFIPITYGEKRWNGVVWSMDQVIEYNRLLKCIEQVHRSGRDAQTWIDELYRHADRYDHPTLTS